jgi:hypothetical protein
MSDPVRTETTPPEGPTPAANPPSLPDPLPEPQGEDPGPLKAGQYRNVREVLPEGDVTIISVGDDPGKLHHVEEDEAAAPA